MNIWLKDFDMPFKTSRVLTQENEPIRNYSWSYDGKYILYSLDKGGNENDNIYAISTAENTGNTESGTQGAHNLTPKEKIKASIVGVSEKDPDVLWVGINDRDPRWHDFYQLSISTGKLTLLRENKDRLTSVYFDWNEKMRLATRTPQDGSTEILRLNADGSSTKIYECGVLENVSVEGFTKDNKKVYISTNKGITQNLTRLALLDPETMEVTNVEEDPLHKVDLDGITFSDKNHDIIFTSYTDAKTRRYFKDKTFEADYKFVQSKFPGMEINFNNSTTDENKWLISVYSDDKLPSVYFFNRTTREVVFEYTPRASLKPYEPYFSKIEAITYKSSDGLDIPAYLALPKGVAAKNLPLIVFPHGGPWARDVWGFNGFAQWLANRGYAVLMPNFRGSTGYGKKFLDAGNKQWGMLMQDDITWGVKYLVSKGIVDAKRVGIMGGSYGGYATLAGLAFTPDVYAVGVSIVGPSNLITLLNSLPPYWEAGRKIFYERMGDPSTEQGKALLMKQSPLNSAVKIKVPLLIIQGANDPRVNKKESEQIVIALRDLGRKVEYICAPDEGHGYVKPLNNMAAFSRAEIFLANNLKGRAQQDNPPDVIKTLRMITVDVNTLTAGK
jgi:dipeptidyl aminopeptidase/acylaminoacyl peptidase